jgi:CarD family transcriptional regulator, regulator of rRNA transcription
MAPKKESTLKTKATGTASSKKAASSGKSTAARASRASSAHKSSSKSSVASRTGSVKAKSASAGAKSAATVKPTKTPVASKSMNDSKSAAKTAKSVSRAAAKSDASKKSATTSKVASGSKAKATSSKSKLAPVKGASKGAADKSAAAKASPKAAKASKSPKLVVARKAVTKPAETPVSAASSAVPTGAAARAVAASIAEAAQRKISAPVKPVKTPKAIAERTAEQRDAVQQKKAVSQRHGFKTNEQVVYPAHGVGCIIGIEEQEIAGMSLELFVINFEKEKLTLRVPTGKLETVGLRKLAEDNVVEKALDVLKGRARIKRTMWSRRAQEYVAKINSGDIIAIAEVVRDLYRSEAQPEQSYSERQLYEDALDRMAREVAAVLKLDERGAIQRITDVLSKSARTRRAAEEEAGEGNSESPQAA